MTRWNLSKSELISTRKSLEPPTSTVSQRFTLTGSKGRSLFLLKEKCNLNIREGNLKRKHSEAFAPDHTNIFQKAHERMI